MVFGFILFQQIETSLQGEVEGVGEETRVVVDQDCSTVAPGREIEIEKGGNVGSVGHQSERGQGHPEGQDPLEGQGHHHLVPEVHQDLVDQHVLFQDTWFKYQKFLLTRKYQFYQWLEVHVNLTYQFQYQG